MTRQECALSQEEPGGDVTHINNHVDEEPYSLLFSYLCECHTACKPWEAASDAVIALDGILHGTQSSIYLPLQQRQRSAAVSELLWCAAMRNTNDVSSNSTTLLGLGKRQNACGTVRAGRGLGMSGQMELPPPLEHNTRCAYSVHRGEVRRASNIMAANTGLEGAGVRRTHSSRQGDHLTRHMHSTSSSTGFIDDEANSSRPSCFEGSWDGHTSAEDVDPSLPPPLFLSPTRFVASEGDAVATRNCSLCIAQALLQSCWLNLHLLQILHLTGLAHVSAAPLSLPDEVIPLTPEESVVHTYHIAQRWFQIALHASFMVAEEVPLATRCAYKFFYFDRRTLSPEWKSQRSFSGCYPKVGKHVSHEDCHRQTSGRLVHLCLQMSFALLGAVQYLYPALPSSSHVDEDSSVATLDVPASATVDGNSAEGGDDEALLYADLIAAEQRLRVEEYSVGDLLCVLRTRLLQTCQLGFVRVSGGARAKRQLLGTALVFHAIVVAQGKEGRTGQFADLLYNSSAAMGVDAGEVRQLTRRDCLFYHVVEMWASQGVPYRRQVDLGSKAVPTDEDSSAQQREEMELSHTEEVEEWRRMLVLLYVFMELVDLRDMCEERCALLLCKEPELSVGSLAHVDATYQDHLYRWHLRLERAANLIDLYVQPFLVSLRNSSNGSVSSRGRHTLALYWVLRAELSRFLRWIKDECTFEGRCVACDNPPDVVSAESHHLFLKQASRQAVTECSAAREFVGITMLPPVFRLPGDNGQDSPNVRLSTCWRLMLPENSTTRTAVAHGEDETNINELAVLPPVWLRLWLVLGCSIFSSAVADLVLANDRLHQEKRMANVPQPNQPGWRWTTLLGSVENGVAEFQKCRSPQDKKRKECRPAGSRNGALRKRRSLGKTHQGEYRRGCIEARKPTAIASHRRRELTVTLARQRCSKAPICFWYRFCRVMEGRAPSTTERFHALAVGTDVSCEVPWQGKEEVMSDRYVDVSEAAASLFLFLSADERLHASTKLAAEANGIEPLFSTTLQNAYPLFSSGREAFRCLVPSLSSGGLTMDSTRKDNDMSAYCLSLPAHVPRLQQHIRHYATALQLCPVHNDDPTATDMSKEAGGANPIAGFCAASPQPLPPARPSVSALVHGTCIIADSCVMPPPKLSRQPGPMNAVCNEKLILRRRPTVAKVSAPVGGSASECTPYIRTDSRD